METGNIEVNNYLSKILLKGRKRLKSILKISARN